MTNDNQGRVDRAVNMIYPKVVRGTIESIIVNRLCEGADMRMTTDRYEKVMQLAHQEARQDNYSEIGTDHILRGLLKLNEGVAITVLTQLGVDLNEVQVLCDAYKRPLSDTEISDEFKLTPRAKKVIELAKQEASALNCAYLGTEHLLLGMLDESECMAAEILSQVTLRIDDVRAKVKEILYG